MADFNFVTERIATGGAITCVGDVQQLQAVGITHIIDCRAELDDAMFLSTAGMAYLFNGVNDDGQPKPTSWFQKSIDFALPALIHPKAKVYAHCAAGVNRGPSTAYAIMLALGIPDNTASALIHARRPVTIVGIAYARDAERAVKELGYV